MTASAQDVNPVHDTPSSAWHTPHEGDRHPRYDDDKPASSEGDVDILPEESDRISDAEPGSAQQHPATPTTVPFPTADLTTGYGTPFLLPPDELNPSLIPSRSPGADSLENTSPLTYSDKLSALPGPSPANSPNPNRTAFSNVKSPVFSSLKSPAFTSRGFRRSLDASFSLPSFGSSSMSENVHPATPSLGAWASPGGPVRPRASASEGSLASQASPRRRRSTEADRASLPTVHSLKQALTRGLRGSDPYLTAHAAGQHSEPANRPRSRSHSRGVSPLRSVIQQWSANFRAHRTEEEPFIPIDPFLLREHLHLPTFSCFPCCADDDLEAAKHINDGDDVPHCSICAHTATSNLKAFPGGARTLFLHAIPRVLYLYFLLRLPSLYFSRVARIFQDAEVSRPDIERMINSAAEDDRSHLRTPPGQAPAVTPGIERLLPLSDAWTPPNVSPALARFKNNWEGFIDSLIREWKTLNLVSALLLSAILTMFQIPDAATDPVTRNAALLSLICALMSLTYGCIYIVRFGTMRSMYRASRWAEEAQKTNTAILWNVWVLLAMPAVWLSWSMVMFITTILSFVWRTGAVDDPEERDPLPVHIALAPRIIITAVFGLGMVYFALIVHSLKSYGGRAAARRKAQRSPRVLQGEPAARRGGEGTMRNQSATAGLQGHAGQNGHAGENRHAGQNGHVAQNGHAGFTTKEAVKGDEWRGRERERRSRSASDELKKGVTGGVHITSEAVSGDPNGFEEKR